VRWLSTGVTLTLAAITICLHQEIDENNVVTEQWDAVIDEAGSGVMLK